MQEKKWGLGSEPKEQQVGWQGGEASACAEL